jgi:hypothetical protein
MAAAIATAVLGILTAIALMILKDIHFRAPFKELNTAGAKRLSAEPQMKITWYRDVENSSFPFFREIGKMAISLVLRVLVIM